MWHTGTLDPLATWCLLVAVWEYTKLIPYIEKAQKTYRATIQLDGISPSLDSDTEISYISSHDQKRFSESLSIQNIEEIMQKHFLGKISQIPPKYSALKIWGKRALDRTLAGEDVTMQARDAEILDYKILWFSYPSLELEITVSAGTYIRSIARDIWEQVWSGGYISALRRTKIDTLDIWQAVDMDSVSGENTVSPGDIFPEMIHIFTDETVYQRLGNGQRVKHECDLPENKDIFLFDGNVIRYVVEYKHSVLHPRKKIV